MWVYRKILEFPVNIKNKDVTMGMNILAQFGGPNGELGAALRYLSQRYFMLDNEGKALLTDIGTEELAHIEIIQSMIYQCFKDATAEDFEKAGFGGYYAQYSNGIFPSDANGVPFTSANYGISGNAFANLQEDLAAEQKARATYESLLNLTDNPEIISPLEFLRQREIVHFQRFGELLNKYENMKK